jgi:hypothetical protein
MGTETPSPNLTLLFTFSVPPELTVMSKGLVGEPAIVKIEATSIVLLPLAFKA